MGYWACAQLEPHRERLALHCLEHVAGYTVYSPRIRARSNGAHGHHSKAAHGQGLRPLFPGYCFILVIAQWWSARWSPGIVRLVMANGRPAVVGDHIISEIRSRERDGVVILPEQQLRRGDPVRIVRGPLRELEGLYAGQAAHERVAVLLATLGRVTLPKDAVEAVE
jgi:transcription antitermination factor NusG